MKKIYIVRHGETTWNTTGKTQGSNDVPLSLKGIKQSICVGKRLKKYEIQRIFASSLKRSVKTAQIINSFLNVPIITTHCLKEMNFGKWEGLTLSQIAQRFPHQYKLWQTEADKTVIPDGETIADVNRRLDSLLSYINQINEKRLLLVTHALISKLLIIKMLGLNIGCLTKLKHNNGGISLVEYQPLNSRLIFHNDTSHLGRYY
ncbi:MAG TPA: histidine phosphatase family protein [Clostridiales bacterium]|nr:histidine phosphatase family protein [Clostridiales bacterium]